METKKNTLGYRLETDKVKPLKKTDLLEIHGREWFDKVNGNSYHCVYISINNRVVITVPFTYGYEDSYIQSATQALTKAGYTKGNIINIQTYCRIKNIHCVCHLQRGCKKNQLPTAKSLGL